MIHKIISLIKNIRIEENFGKKERKPYKEEMTTNNVGDGKIAGTVQAGDDPPVRKKKKYCGQRFT